MQGNSYKESPASISFKFLKQKDVGSENYLKFSKHKISKGFEGYLVFTF